MFFSQTNGNDNTFETVSPNLVSAKNKLIGLAALAAVAVVTANPAQARDGKAYSGTECKALSPNINVNNVTYSSRGGVLNISRTSSVRVVCPAVRDTGADITGTVQVVDGNTSSNVSCTLKSIARNGISLGQSTRRSNSRFSNVLPLDFNTRVRGAGGASIYFECSIPPLQQGRLSEIVSYEIMEL